MLVSELAPMLLIVTVTTATFGFLLGITDSTLGVVALWFLGLSAAGLVWLIVVAAGTGRSAGRQVGGSSPGRVNVGLAAWPNPYRLPVDLAVTEGIAYMDGQHLDFYERSGSSGTERPVLIQIHGGSWGGGNRRQQARPLIHEMARRDWLVASVDYPLVPEATFPENLIAIHNAVGWIRSNAADLRIDASCIFVTGGSSGAHLASLAALTDRNAEWGSGGVEVPPIAGAVTFYGVYDLLNRDGVRDEWPVVSRSLIKADKTKNPEMFRQASPSDQVSHDAPPFLIIHGTHDSLVPAAESINFASALSDVSENIVDLVLLKGASHAFDAIPSLRTQQLVYRVADYLEAVVGKRSHSS